MPLGVVRRAASGLMGRCGQTVIFKSCSFVECFSLACVLQVFGPMWP
jgi:hypothetical protein